MGSGFTIKPSALSIETYSKNILNYAFVLVVGSIIDALSKYIHDLVVYDCPSMHKLSNQTLNAIRQLSHTMRARDSTVLPLCMYLADLINIVLHQVTHMHCLYTLYFYELVIQNLSHWCIAKHCLAGLWSQKECSSGSQNALMITI